MKSIICVFIFVYLLNNPQKDFIEDKVVLVTYKAEIKRLKSSNQKLTETVHLFITSEKSVFIDYKILLKRNALQKNISPQERAGELSSIGALWFQSIVVKNLRDNTTTVLEEHLKKQYNAYQQPSMSAEHWNITNDTDSLITGLKTYKAQCQFGGRHWVAWFTPEIPVSDGPYKFGGLPGLILKLESADGDFTFHILGIDRLPSAKLVPELPDYQLINQNKFQEIQQIIRNNPFVQFESNGGTIVGDIKVNGKYMTKEELLIFLKKDLDNYNYIE